MAEAIDESLQASLRFFLRLSQLGERDVSTLLILGKFKVRTLLSLGRTGEHSHALLNQFGDTVHPLIELVHATLGVGLTFQYELDRAFDIHAARITRGIIPTVRP